jgi:4-diphosphocytidyl-2-C-methyl-D-erythritol kinase
MIPEVLKIRAPAKINLGLRLLGVRSDGYHTLESVFAPIGVWDDLEVEIMAGAPGIELAVVLPNSDGDDTLSAQLSDVTHGPDNLVVRAATAFCKESGFDRRIGLRLNKRIPAGAGLGGGSSDAAAVLVGLASLVDADVSAETLHSLALGLGADVPFFLSPTPALVSGIGEKIEPLDGVPPLDLVVVNPGISLATAEVYRAADALRGALTDGRPGSTMRAISRLRGETGDLAPALGDLLINDLEPAARRLCPPVARLIERLSEVGAIGVSMSGSGATVFGVFASAPLANQAAQVLRSAEADECWIQVTRIITADVRKDETLGA